MKATEFDEMYGRYLDVSKIARKELDIAYGSTSARQCLDIYYPEEGEGPFPAVVFWHGGAFFKGDKRRYQLAPALNGIYRGYAVISAGYRLAPDSLWPAYAEDAASALAFIQVQAAELNIDANRIAVWGESAGAELALIVGLTDTTRFGIKVDPVRAIVDWYGPSGWEPDVTDGENSDLTDNADASSPFPDGMTLEDVIYGKGETAHLAGKRSASILGNIRDGALPWVLIEHGLSDELVNPEGSRVLEDELKKRGAVVESRYVPSAGHGVGFFNDENNLNIVFDFLDRALSNKQTS